MIINLLFYSGYFVQYISGIPHTRGMRLPDSSTMFALTYELIFIPSKVSAFVSTGLNSLKRSVGTLILIRVEALH